MLLHFLDLRCFLNYMLASDSVIFAFLYTWFMVILFKIPSLGALLGPLQCISNTQTNQFGVIRIIRGESM